MNRTTRNGFLAHKCYVTICRNRSSCIACSTGQPIQRCDPSTSTSSKDCHPIKSFEVPRRYGLKMRSLLRSSKPMNLSYNFSWLALNDVKNLQLRPCLSFTSASNTDVISKRFFRTTASSTLGELMQPQAENVIKPTETTFTRTYDLDPAEKKIHVEEHLSSLVDVFVNSGRVEDAHEVLIFHHLLGRSEPSAPILDDVAMYNTVLQGWSRKGDWTNLKELLNLMVRDGLKPNLQSCAAALECAARAGGSEQEMRVQDLLKCISESGLDIRNLNLECHFASDQREHVLQAVRSVYLDFKPLPRQRVSDYICSLTHSPIITRENMNFPSWLSQLAQTIKDDAETQLRWELEGKVAVSSLGKGRGHWQGILEKCQANWRQSLTEEFRDRVINFQKSTSMMGIRGLSLRPYLDVLNYEVYVSLMIDEIAYIGTHGYLPSPNELHKMLGIKVMEQYRLQNRRNNGVLKKTQFLYEHYCKYYCDANLRSQYTPQQYWEELLVKHADGPDINYPEKEWPVKIQTEVGRFLYQILKKAKIDLKLVKLDGVKLKKRHVNLFPKVFNPEDPYKKSDNFEVNGNLCKVYRNAHQEEIPVITNWLPMTSPPLPWMSHSTGGFLLSSAPFVRLAALDGDEQQKHISSKSVQELSPLFEAVNYLSDCPWIINKGILDLMVSVFSDGGSMELGIPPRSSPLLRISYTEPDMTEEEITTIKRKNYTVRQQRSRLKRLWNKLYTGLQVAMHYRDRVIWFPHTLDFRGRVYPHPNQIRHSDGDAIRSLLLFAEGKPLGPNGLNWLKLHLVNLTGLKKMASLAERLAFCKELQSEIEDSADQPLTGRRWWSQAKEPWQALSTCIEIVNAQRSTNPESYVCHIPVHQDGSSNGLQHYAALGRDSEGANLVNLSLHNMPQDIYSEVAKAVEEARKTDAAEGLELARLLEGFIHRNIVKETVMTTVNGVMSRNSRWQIEHLLGEASFPSEHVEAAAEYIANKAYTSTRATFQVSSRIQKWLMNCAVQITQVSGRPVEWETPLGFPIVQPYLVPKKKWNDSNSENQDDDHETLVLRKQRRAFPPNYIQSLESTHLMLTALFCQKAGATFAAVHDSYWTHPSTVDIMNRICREQFVKMHSMPLLESLSDFMIKTYCERTDLKDPSNKETLKSVLSSVPEKGNFDLKEVLSSTYFFS